MTIDQMRLHIKAHTKKTLLNQINEVVLNAVASQGDNKAVNETIKNLQKVIRDIDSK